MQSPFLYRLKGQQLWLSPARCIFWEEERSLIVSDLHFGKTGHFRKSGIGVPQSLYQEDLIRLLSLIQHFQPRQLLVVGDLFHSRENKELALFQRWREDFPDLGIHLIKGNHDILHNSWYRAAGIELTPERLQIGEFAFIHDITAEVKSLAVNGPDAGGRTSKGKDQTSAGKDKLSEGKDHVSEDCRLSTASDCYSFSGHIHPGIRINGLGKQSLRFPCFYFGEEYAILPAYSRFTGMASIYPAPGENVFAILPGAPGSIFQIQ